MVLVELDVLAAERHGRAVDGRERRPELVGDRGDELALQALDAAFFGQVAQRVDRSVGELDGGDGDPELPVAEVERQRLGVLRRIRGSASPPARAARLPPNRKARRAACASSASAAAIPVTAASAGFQRRTTPASSTKKTPSPMWARTRAARPLLLNFLPQPPPVEDVPRLLGDQLGDCDRERVELARGRDRVERQDPTGRPLVADRNDEGAACRPPWRAASSDVARGRRRRRPAAFPARGRPG